MKVLNVEWSNLSVQFVDERRIKLNESIKISVHTGVGVFRFWIDAGFNSDGRSGGLLVDRIIPHYGNEITFLCWLVHDALFQSHALSFETANVLLDAMLEYAGYGRIKRGVVGFGVGSFIGRDAYEDADKWDIINKGKVHFNWDSK